MELAARALAEWIRLQAEGRRMLGAEQARGDKSYPEPEPAGGTFKVRAPESREAYQRAVRPRLAKAGKKTNGQAAPEKEAEKGEAEPPEEKRVAKA